MTPDALKRTRGFGSLRKYNRDLVRGLGWGLLG